MYSIDELWSINIYELLLPVVVIQERVHRPFIILTCVKTRVIGGVVLCQKNYDHFFTPFFILLVIEMRMTSYCSTISGTIQR